MLSSETSTEQVFGHFTRRVVAQISGEKTSGNEGATSLFAKKVGLPKDTIEEIFQGKVLVQGKDVLSAVINGVPAGVSRQLVALIAEISTEIADELANGHTSVPLSSS